MNLVRNAWQMVKIAAGTILFAGVMVMGIVWLVAFTTGRSITSLFQRKKTMSQKVCALLISHEKFLETAGNGSSNMGSPTATGKNTPAILKKKVVASSSPLALPYNSQSAEPSSSRPSTCESGTCGETATNIVSLSDMDEVAQSFWSKTLYQPTKSGK